MLVGASFFKGPNFEFLRESVMTPDERDQMYRLCAQIAVEKDHQKFSELLKELNDLLEMKEGRLGLPAKGNR